jgi:uncharacterized membrane protein YfcA
MIVSVGSASLLAAVVFGTSVLSGVFGMAGGMILLGVLLLLMDVAPAMVLFGLIQLVANGWRTWLWRAHVTWRIIAGYGAGALVSFGLMKFVAFLPDKATVYILLGALPFLASRLPPALAPDINRRGAPFLCGLGLMVVQLLAGATGSVLDLFFNRSELDRKQIVATKAATQVVSHLLRVAYFGTFASALGEFPAAWLLGALALCAVLGTTAAVSILHRMSDQGFRRWSRFLILGISAFYVLHGVWLLLA